MISSFTPPSGLVVGGGGGPAASAGRPPSPPWRWAPFAAADFCLFCLPKDRQLPRPRPTFVTPLPPSPALPDPVAAGFEGTKGCSNCPISDASDANQPEHPAVSGAPATPAIHLRYHHQQFIQGSPAWPAKTRDHRRLPPAQPLRGLLRAVYFVYSPRPAVVGGFSMFVAVLCAS